MEKKVLEDLLVDDRQNPEHFEYRFDKTAKSRYENNLEEEKKKKVIQWL